MNNDIKEITAITGFDRYNIMVKRAVSRAPMKKLIFGQKAANNGITCKICRGCARSKGLSPLHPTNYPSFGNVFYGIIPVFAFDT